MTLEELIASNPDPRELKRALVVKMRIQGMKHREVRAILSVHSSYLSRWEKKYPTEGVIRSQISSFRRTRITEPSMAIDRLINSFQNKCSQSVTV